MFDELITSVKAQSAVKSNYIPDIITFCEDPHYLNICDNPENPINLYPLQRISLKTFYRGSKGNKKLKLTNEEIELLKEKDMEYVIDKFNGDDLFREMVLPWGRRCLGEESLIFNPDTGDMSSVGSMWNNNIRKTEVCSLDENDYTFKKKTAKIIYNGIMPVFRIKLLDGRCIDATENHPFLTISGWKKLEELSIKDRIAAPASLPFFTENQDYSDETFRLIGYITGDGCCSVPNQVGFSCSDKNILDDFSECVKSLDKNLCVTHKVRYGYSITKREYVRRNTKNALIDLLRKINLQGKTAHTKTVPEVVLQSSKKQTKNYLQALFSCDGSLYFDWSSRDNKCSPRITYTTVSKDLAYGIHFLLIKFGIFSKLRKKSNIKSNFNSCGHSYQIDIDNCSSTKKYLQEIGFVGKEDKIKKALEIIENITVKNNFVNSIPIEIWEYIDEEKKRLKISTDKKLMSMPVGERKARCRRQYSPSREKIRWINKRLKSNYLKKILSDDIIWMPIKSITTLGEQRTFDLSIDDDNCHNFIANNIVSHNSGKDMVTSLLACYEAMRLLEIPGGNPFTYYGIKAGNPIYILTVASSESQAKILFNEIKTVILSSPYFQDKIGDNGKAIDTSRVFLLTPADKAENEERAKKGIEPIRGNIVILAGHSHSDTLRGHRCFALLLDEIATYPMTSGSGGGEVIFSALSPSTNDFRVQYKENGEIKTRLDSKIVAISSPRGKEGIFWRMWNQCFDKELGRQRFGMRAPTWDVVLRADREDIRRDYPAMTEQMFNMEFGAEFAGLEGEKFIADEYIDKAINPEMGQRLVGVPGIFHYGHVDPAASSNNYAFIIIHVESYIKEIRMPDTHKTKREQRKRFVVDHMKIWTPTTKAGINFEVVDQYVINMSKRFRFTMVSYDAFESRASMQKLRRAGVPVKLTSFRKRYKVEIYKNLEQLLLSGDIVLPGHGPHAKLLEMELKNLKRLWTPSGGFKIGPNEEGEVKTDDLCFAPDTMILMSDYSYKKISEISEGERVITEAGRDKKVLKVYKNTAPSHLCKIHPFYSSPMFCTKNHPFQIVDGGFKAAENLSLNDNLVLSLKIPPPPSNVSFDLAEFAYSDNKQWKKQKDFIQEDKIKCNNANAKWHRRYINLDTDFCLLVGLYLAEGSCHHHGLNFAFHENEIGLHETVENLVQKIFGIGISKSNNIMGKCITISVNSMILKRFFRKLFGYEKAITKKIPSCFMNSDEKCIESLLKGMFLGDGCYNEKEIVFVTTSECMALQVRYLLLRLGIISGFSKSKRKGKEIDINSHKAKYNADLFITSIKWYQSYNKMSTILDLNLSKNISKFHKPKAIFNNGQVNLQICKIEKVNSNCNFIYNLEVEDDHTYITQTNVHNCDSLAGACGIALQQLVSGLPKSEMVYMPIFRETGGQMWNIGQGTYTQGQWNQLHQKFGIGNY